MAEWGAKRVAEEDLPQEWLQAVREQRNALIPRIQKTVRLGGSIFGEPVENSQNSMFSEIKDSFRR